MGLAEISSEILRLLVERYIDLLVELCLRKWDDRITENQLGFRQGFGTRTLSGCQLRRIHMSSWLWNKAGSTAHLQICKRYNTPCGKQTSSLLIELPSTYRDLKWFQIQKKIKNHYCQQWQDWRRKNLC